MMRTLLVLAAAAVVLLAVLALTRGGPRPQTVAKVLPPQPAPAAASVAPVRAAALVPKAAPAAPAEPEVAGVDEDAAAVGMTTRDAAPADQAGDTPVEKKEP